MIVDAHCHVSPVWFEPVETVLFQMDRTGVERAVLVQVLGQYDNGYQQACMARFPGRFASVVGVDAEAADARATLARLAEAGATGVRLRPLANSPGEDPLAIWRTAERLRLTVSCVGTTAQFRSESFSNLLGALPGLEVVLEHLGGLARPDAEPEARDAILSLSRWPNVSLKLPALGQLVARGPRLPTEGSPLNSAAAAPLLLKAVESFGASRLMWGSDFPPVASREGYANSLAWTRDLLGAHLAEAELAEMFGGAAARLFCLS